MSFDSNIHSRTENLVKLSSLILAMAFLSACAAPGAAPSAAPGLVNPSTCPNEAAIDLVLKIVQDNDPGDAESIRCPDGSNCNNAPGKARVMKNDWVRWELASGNSSPEFYVIFDKDQSIGQEGNGRGPNRVASTNAKLCVRVHGAATSSYAGIPYRYSVYVKHCTAADVTCKPIVLDPIIYVYQ